MEGSPDRLDWSESFDSRIRAARLDTFSGPGLGHEVSQAGGTAGAVLNAANEAAVAAFLAGGSVYEIVPGAVARPRHHAYDPDPSLTLDSVRPLGSRGGFTVGFVPDALIGVWFQLKFHEFGVAMARPWGWAS